MATLFEKFAQADDGDRIEVFGESLRVGNVRQSICERTVDVWGAHEDPSTVGPRYFITVDPRYDSVQIYPTDRTDTHDD